MKNLVFIVEDNPVQQKMLKLHFEESLGNYDVRTFANPEEMLGHLSEKPFAVVLDHFFEDGSAKTGLDYLSIIKKNSSTSSIPIIYHTSSTDQKIKDDALSLGAAQFIPKDSASLVRLRTALDLIHEQNTKKKGFLSKFFN